MLPFLIIKNAARGGLVLGGDCDLRGDMRSRHLPAHLEKPEMLFLQTSGLGPDLSVALEVVARVRRQSVYIATRRNPFLECRRAQNHAQRKQVSTKLVVVALDGGPLLSLNNRGGALRFQVAARISITSASRSSHCRFLSVKRKAASKAAWLMSR
jgi:hypothetical protein